jgi:threonine/homoserine/homoserine lactone efflux protein
VGCLSHTLLAAVDVSALIAASPLAFTILKIIGGAYLVWLGIGALRSSGQTAPGQANTAASSWLLFGRGLFANAINPKVVLFFLAFLPQFVDPARGHSGWQIVQLGVLMTLMTALIFGAIGYFSGTVGLWLQRRPKAGLWLDRIAGGLFVGLGLKLIVSR